MKTHCVMRTIKRWLLILAFCPTIAVGQKISALPDATAVATTDEFACAQNDPPLTTRKCSADDIRSFIAVTDPLGISNINDDILCAGSQKLGRNSGDTAWECTADDDVPDAGDFGAATDLDSNGALVAGAVSGGSAGDITDGTVDSNDLATANETQSEQLIWKDPAATDEFVLMLGPVAGTMTRVDCRAIESTKSATAVTFTIDVCDGDDTGDDTCTTSILGATMVCDEDSQTDSTLSAAGFVAYDQATIVLTAVSATAPDLAIVTITYTVN